MHVWAYRKIREIVSGQQNKTAGIQRRSEPCSWHCPEGTCQVLLALSLGLTFSGHVVIYPPNRSAWEVKGGAVWNTLGIPLLLKIWKAARVCHSHPNNRKMLNGVQNQSQFSWTHQRAEVTGSQETEFQIVKSPPQGESGHMDCFTFDSAWEEEAAAIGWGKKKLKKKKKEFLKAE